MVKQFRHGDALKKADLNEIAHQLNTLKRNGYMDIPVSRLLYEEASEGGGGTDTSITFTNNSGAIIPAYAALEVTNVSSAGVHTVVKPTTDSLANGYVIFNGGDTVAIGANGTGYHCTDLYKTCMINADSDPVGSEWGTTNGQWYLTKDNTGFVCIGAQTGEVSVAWMRPFKYRWEWETPGSFEDVEGLFPEEWYNGGSNYTFIQYGEDTDALWGSMKHSVWQPFNFKTNAFAQTARVSKWDNSAIAGTSMCHRSWAGFTYEPFESSEPSFDPSYITRAYVILEFDWLKNDLVTSQGIDPTMDDTVYIMMAPYNDPVFTRSYGWLLDDTVAADPAVSTTNTFINAVDDKIGEKVRVYETDTGDNYTGEIAYIQDTELNELFDPSGVGINFIVDDIITLSPVVNEQEFNGFVAAVDATTITDSTHSWVVDSLVGRQVWRFGLPSIYWTITSNTDTVITASGGTDIDDTINIGDTFTVGPEYDSTTVDTGTVTSKTSLTLTDSSKSWTINENANKRLFRGTFNPLVPYEGATYWNIASNIATVLTVDSSGSQYYRNAVKVEEIFSQVYNADGNTNARMWHCEDEDGWKQNTLIPLLEVSTDDRTTYHRMLLPLSQVRSHITFNKPFQFVVVPKDFDKSGKVMHCAVFPQVLVIEWDPPGP